MPTLRSYLGPDLLPCPFCGFIPQLTDDDVLYPVSNYGDVWTLVCPETSGGCGTSILEDSPEGAINKWNTRII